MKEQDFIDKYFDDYGKTVFQEGVSRDIIAAKEAFLKCRHDGKKAIFAGNGASASISGHAATDFTKQAGVRSVCFSDPALLTAFANDYGYEHWVEKALEFYADKGDLIVLISSSGKSPNMVNAAKQAKERGHFLITLTGFSEENPLKALGDINFWARSGSYNIVESTHMFWLMTVCDLIIGKAEYSVS